MSVSLGLIPKNGGKRERTWFCVLCENENYADREACNRCKADRSKSQTFCRGCDVWNDARRDECFKCKAEIQSIKKKPRVDSGDKKENYKIPPNWNCRECRFSNFDRNDKCKQCNLPRIQSQWVCGSCSNWNYLDRRECNRCGKHIEDVEVIPVDAEEEKRIDADSILQSIELVRPEFNGNRYRGSGGKYDMKGLISEWERCVNDMKKKYKISTSPTSDFIRISEKPRQSENRRSSSSGPIPVQVRVARPEDRANRTHVVVGNDPIQNNQKSASDWIRSKPGSWNCHDCGNPNFADREDCNRCKLPRKKNLNKDDWIRKQNGSWNCHDCDNINFADREECNRCKLPRPRAKLDDDEKKSDKKNLDSLPVENMVKHKEGSWECMDCDNWNYADRENCNKCKASRSAVEVL